MSVKITGLDKMQKQLKEVERATEALNGSYDVHFDANDPVSIENAIHEPPRKSWRLNSLRKR